MKIAGKVFRNLTWVVLALGVAEASGSPGGYTGRTLKTSTAGCGGCHGSGRNMATTVGISGPASVQAGGQAAFTVTVTGQTGNGGGVNIAALRGGLVPGSGFLRTMSGELTQNSGVTVPTTYQFMYTAPATPGTDTIYATGKANGDRWNWAPNAGIIVTPGTSVGSGSETPAGFALRQNFPNPFNPTTTIVFDLPSSGPVRLSVHSADGAHVATIAEGILPAGRHSYAFEASDLASGIYVYRLTTSSTTAVRKMAFVR